MKLKPFKPLTTAEQRELYPQSLQRAKRASRATLFAKYRAELERADELEKTAKRLACRVDDIEDAVANRADRTYHGWDVWRCDPVLLRKVAGEMMAASAQVRAKIAGYEAEAVKLRKPYVEEVDALDRLTEQLLLDAKVA